MSKVIRQLVVLSVFVFAVGLAGEARALSYIDFNVPSGAAGTITYAGGANPIIGSGITIDLISGGPLNAAAPVACASCTLDFQTGNFAGGMTFLGGGSITITGGFDAANNGNFTNPEDITPGSTLLSGVFDEVLLIPGTQRILFSTIIDTKHPLLLSFFGIAPNTNFTTSGTNIGFFWTAGVEPGSFSSTRIFNSNVVNAVDTPGSLLLLCTGLAGLIYLRFHQLRRI